MQVELFPEGTKFTDRDPRTRIYSLFFALLPGPGAGRQIESLAPALLARSGVITRRHAWRFIEANRLHLSLHLVREQRVLDQKFIAIAEQVARNVLSPAFELAFDVLATFPPIPSREDRRPFILKADSPALRELFEKLGAEMCRIGLVAFADFEPHMTLAYGPQAIPSQRIEPINVLFADFALIKSAKGAHHYDICKRWPLLGG